MGKYSIGFPQGAQRHKTKEFTGGNIINYSRWKRENPPPFRGRLSPTRMQNLFFSRVCDWTGGTGLIYCLDIRGVKFHRTERELSAREIT
jgi:hypothetical protein